MMVIETIKRFPWAISFIAQGATAKQWGIKSIKIDGLPPKDEDYPYYQVFFYVTKGKPAGHAKAFIDFALSKKEKAIIKKRGLTPIS